MYFIVVHNDESAIGCIFVFVDLCDLNWQGKQEEGHRYSSTAEGLLKALHSFPDSLSIRYLSQIDMLMRSNCSFNILND
jgi:hypothetical protein